MPNKRKQIKEIAGAKVSINALTFWNLGWFGAVGPRLSHSRCHLPGPMKKFDNQILGGPLEKAMLFFY